MQELRIEPQRKAFTRELAHVVTALGAIPDDPPPGFTIRAMVRLRQPSGRAAGAGARRIGPGAHHGPVQQLPTRTTYENRAAEQWSAT